PVRLREYFPFGLARRCADGIRIETGLQEDRERFANGLSEFLRAAEKLAEFDHRALPKVLNTLEFNATGYQVMSFEQGQSLSAWLESAYSFKEDQLRLLFEALLAGLKAAHERGLVHGMICPENILVRDNGDPVLINFPAGLPRIARNASELSGQLREGYASAEQYRPDHLATPADDLYALAATLYRGLTGRTPLSAPERLKLLENGRPDPAAQSISSPAPWIKAVDWMLRPEAKDRPQYVSQVERFLIEVTQESQSDQESSGIGTFRLTSVGNTIMKTGSLIAAALVMILVAGILVRTFQAPDFPGKRDAGDPAGGMTAGAAAPENKDRGHFEPRAELSGSKTAGRIEQVMKSTGPSTSASEYPSLDSGEADRIALNVKEPEPTVNSDNESPMPEKSLAKPKAPLNQVESDQLAPAIAGHLAAAEKNLAAFNLTTPKDHNAYSDYQAVLGLDPANPEARSGINQILERYLWLIESALRRGRLRNAEAYLARAEAVAAASPALDSVRSRLEKARKALSDRGDKS
ncbi:MAG: hypothetical protein L0Y43_00340, partial [Methylococcaceae bacterium]|nr:hypothetical protein [Methylococcaceae bacterium]